jgi:hypothetical protein
MNEAPSPRWHALLDLPALAGAIFIAVLLGWTAAGRLAFPYDLEWMEGGMLLHALRVAEGQALYVTPTSDFVPFLYPPLYHWLLGAIGAVAGVDYLSGRAISLLGTMVGAGALVAAVRQERGSWLLGLGAAGLFLSTYDETGAFFDLVRIDGLLIALLGWSMVAIRGGWLRAGGVLLVLAFATKHNAAAMGLPALLWLWRARGRQDALRFARWSVLPALAFVGGMMLEGDHLFLTYLLGVPAGHGLVAARFFPGAPLELLEALPAAAALSGVGALVWWKRWSAGGAYWAAQGALLLLLCMVMRAHHGGFLNVLIPGTWVLALWGALGAQALRARWGHPLVLVVTASVVGAQCWMGAWDADRFRPTEKDREAGDRVVAAVAKIEGEVFAPWQPWMAVQAGKAPALHLIGLWDIDHKLGPLRDGVDTIEGDIENQRWAAVLTANGKLGYGLDAAYKRGPSVRPAGRALMPRTGWRVRPDRLYLPIVAPAEPPSEETPAAEPLQQQP